MPYQPKFKKGEMVEGVYTGNKFVIIDTMDNVFHKKNYSSEYLCEYATNEDEFSTYYVSMSENGRTSFIPDANYRLYCSNTERQIPFLKQNIVHILDCLNVSYEKYQTFLIDYFYPNITPVEIIKIKKEMMEMENNMERGLT